MRFTGCSIADETSHNGDEYAGAAHDGATRQALLQKRCAQYDRDRHFRDPIISIADASIRANSQ